MEQMDHHRWNPPLDELQLVAETVGRVLDSQGHERIRDVLGDLDALEEAVDRLEAYGRFRPDRFDRRKINRRLKQRARRAIESRCPKCGILTMHTAGVLSAEASGARPRNHPSR